MAVLNPDKDRQILPRWRSFEMTLRLGELDSIEPISKMDVYDLSSKIYDWNAHITVGHAADLVGTAIAIGREEKVVDAARFLLEDNVDISPWIAELAERVLHPSSTDREACEDYQQALDDSELRKRVRRYRSALRDGPRDPVMCVDLSRVYASLGLRYQARKYMDMAIFMEPNNRFVLRSGSRLWAHLGEVDRAHSMIIRSKSTRFDPWLLAAEIATSGALDRSPKFTKIARDMLVERLHPPNHLSELASGLATLELESGSIKKSRRLFKLSLEKPTENSVAQAAWASRRESGIEVDERLLGLPNTFEARSWTCFVKGEWRRVVEECHKWSSDQSFSSRPNILGSYVSAVALQDYSQSKRFAKRGLLVDPDDFVLLNNLTFACINLGEFDAATKSMNMMKRSMTTIDHRVSSYHARAAWFAAHGLLAFRKGRFDCGRRHYLDAVEIAKMEGDDSLLASALAFYAAEAWINRIDDRQGIMDQALHALGRDDLNNLLLKHMLYRKCGLR